MLSTLKSWAVSPARQSLRGVLRDVARGTLSLALASVVSAVDARMYQWVSPNTGRVQLSGNPPPWYRDAAGGARVRVFENGNLVDDTAIVLPTAQSEELREAAFREFEQRQRAEALERLERVARRARRKEEETRRLAESAQARRIAPPGAIAQERVTTDSAAGGGDEPLDASVVDRLKALVSEFDKQGGGL